MKTALVILSDPQAGTDDSNGKLFNALAAAYDFKQAGEEVSILFQGACTRWPEALKNPENPFHALFNAVEDKVQPGRRSGRFLRLRRCLWGQSVGLRPRNDQRRAGHDGPAQFRQTATGRLPHHHVLI